ncbi:hypothetical protein LTR05_004715 [Lithohypha guttulata]|uniref:Importin N-terminal domain-containing protein n=1 Tax=Lithohypha guttulata TaxID=1690604 RepID=A0AAN7SZ71_9EURO|nr:hypothetical protein LTR05_004715 [Lithohypha guttulata]
MEQQVLQLLQATTIPDTNTIKRAEQSLRDLYRQPDYPFALLHITTHSEIDGGLRKAALTALRNYINATWSPTFEESTSQGLFLTDEARTQVRSQILAICTSPSASNDINQNLAASVVSKIASADFPDDWPELFPHLISVINTSSSDAAVVGALRVLHELVDSGLSDEQFFGVARELVNGLQHVAVDTGHGQVVQAMALRVLGACFDNLEQVLQTEHAPAAKAFLNESMQKWMSYFMGTLKQPLPEVSMADSQNDTNTVISRWKDFVAVKTQVIQMLVKVKKVYTASLTPHVFELFQIIWEDLTRSSPAYTQLFVESDGEGKLVDADGLSYTLDALVIEAIDFLSSILKAKAVRTELNRQTQQAGTEQHATPWLQELLRVMVDYAVIPKEEEQMWQLDANIYLSETTSQTANYTPRTACAELITQTLMEWMSSTIVHALVQFIGTSQSASTTTWKTCESAFYLLNQAIKELKSLDITLDQETTTHILQQTSAYTNDPNPFLKGGAHLTLSSVFAVAPDGFNEAAIKSLASAITSFGQDDSEVVNACGLIAITQYLEVLPSATTKPYQATIVESIRNYLSQYDLQDDLEDSDDIKSALIIMLRDAMLLDTVKVYETPALDLFFNLASDGAGNFMICDLLTETFELLVQSVANQGTRAYIKLCEKVIPSLSGAFHISSLRGEPNLAELASELVSKLAEFGSDPLPEGFISVLMPPLQSILMQATDGSVIRPATTAVSHMLNKGTSQFLAWNHEGKSSVELSLTIVDRLISSPDIEESAADEVGSLASSLIDKCGAEVLGSYLSDLLRAVAVRLATAERIPFIQSLLMVFASLAIKVPRDVVNFLQDININGRSGLNVVMTKWLDNSVHFAGFEEIRLNCIALSKIYSLHDSRIESITVKGDLVVVETGRIKTRSQARLNPDTYTSISAPLKILKLLIDELKNAATSQFTNLAAARAAAEALDDEDDDADSLASNDGDADGDDWEDLATTGDGSLDLGSAKVRSELMGLAGEGGGLGSSSNVDRIRDDQSVEYLIGWFKEEAGKQGFSDMFAQLKAEEQKVLQDLVR